MFRKKQDTYVDPGFRPMRYFRGPFHLKGSHESYAVPQEIHDMFNMKIDDESEADYMESREKKD